MMISKSERSDVFAIRLNILHHLLWRRDTSEEEYVLLWRDVAERTSLCAEKESHIAVVQSGEIQLLIWEKIECS